jgi:class 3 adenylate cyclase
LVQQSFCRSYMVLCGHDGEDDHALRLLRCARDMLVLTEQPMHNGERVKVRIGINTGSAHSGVLGTRRLKFTCWGDRYVQFRLRQLLIFLCVCMVVVAGINFPLQGTGLI